MAEFLPAYEAMIVAEGGYVLHNVAGDRGGMTYAGIARNMNPNWSGWVDIDRTGQVPVQQVQDFYRLNYWNPIRGDQIASQAIAQTIFDFAVNAGVGVATKLAQAVVSATADGQMGPRTLALLNQCAPDKFLMAYALAKIDRYRDIVMRDRSQAKFLLGWVNRALAGIKASA